jgi:very-short-patch-repair endonuclease
MKTSKHIVAGQRVDEQKVILSRRLRKEMTPEEAELWFRLRGRQLGGFRFRRQQVIGGFVVDFYCAETDLVVEVDGPIHDSRRDYDAERDMALAARGLRILRIRNDEVTGDIEAVLARIRNACCTDH